MRTLVVLAFFSFSLSLNAVASDPVEMDPPFLDAPPASWGCLQELSAASARGAILRDRNAHERSVGQFLSLGAVSLLLRPEQKFTLDQLRTMELQGRFQVLFDTRLVHIAIAEEIDARGADYDKVLRSFLATYPEAREQSRFLDGVVQRILSRLKMSCWGNLKKFRDTRIQPPKVTLPAVQWLLLDESFLSGFAELEIVILQKLIKPEEAFVQTVMDSGAGGWRKFWRWVWRNPLAASVDVTAKLSEVLADPLNGPTHLVLFLRDSPPTVRDFFLSRNLPLLPSDVLRRVVTELKLSAGMQLTIDRELKSREQN